MSLFPAIMFLLVLSVWASSALNSTLMQEKMVSNTKDLNVAFQAAEAGLRDAEADVVRTSTLERVYVELRKRVVYTALDMALADVGGHLARLVDWSDSGQVARLRRIHRRAGAADSRGTAAVRDRAAVATPPMSPGREASHRAVVPHASIPGGSAYRLTVLATGARPETRVVLQSTYIVKAMSGSAVRARG